MSTINVNGRKHQLEVDPETPLLWVLRDELNLTGTKYGCGVGLCGACTVLIDDQATRSCQIPVKDIKSTDRIITIEGLGESKLHPVQQAWIEQRVPQCGYCQSGQILAAVSLLNSKANPQTEEVNRAMAGNICRCATYPRISSAIKRAVAITAEQGE